MNNAVKVGIADIDSSEYPYVPFHPHTLYPEFAGAEYYAVAEQFRNDVYDGVRSLLIELQLDKINAHTDRWNPLKDFISRGDSVVIKPNLVFDKHPLGNPGVESMITHASIIRPIIDYVLLATNQKCSITICDVPLQSANWDRMIQFNGLLELVAFYASRGVTVGLIDLRYEIALPNKEGVYYKSIKAERDPRGYQVVNLGKKSYLQDIISDYKKLDITDYGIGTVSLHHNPEKNEYLIPKTILDADVFINIPKMKSHRKAGVTLSMKNLIGINGDKSWIAHHRRGVDEYPEFHAFSYFKWYAAHNLKIYVPKWLVTYIYKLYRIFYLKGESIKEHGMKQGGILMEGNWHGNDTLWRTILDLNNIIFFADKEGRQQKTQQRKYITIIDGVIGMDKEGPMEGSPKGSHILVGGFHPVTVDAIASYIMGFDWQKVPVIREGFKEKYFMLTPFSFEDIIVHGNTDWRSMNLKFEASKGWKGHIERDSSFDQYKRSGEKLKVDNA